MPDVWTPSEPYGTIAISDRALKSVEAGNLWIFSNEIQNKPQTSKKGTWCEFENRSHVIGFGYFNAHSLIAGRVVTRQTPIDLSSLLTDKITAAFLRRAPLSQEESSRLIFSEADFLPGLVLDSFSDVLVLQSNTAGIDAALPLLEPLISTCFENVFGRKARSLVVRGDSGIRVLEGVEEFSRVVWGDRDALLNGTFTQNGIKFSANFLEGQKTGFFLDQRDNRQFLNAWLKRREMAHVLDLFCYSGGWGLNALNLGADLVTFVDESPRALDLVRLGVDRNQFPKQKAKYVVSDAFDYLEKEQSTYDVVVCDPPAFVKSKKNLPQAIRAYEKLNRLAWSRVKRGGLLISCSCSYHLPESEFLELLSKTVAKEKTQAHVVFRGGQASDHPILLSMPETRYLKCIALQKL